MTMWAQIENGAVVGTTGIDPKGRFHASIVWVECPPDVAPGWTCDGESFTAPAAESRDIIEARVWESIKADRDQRKEAGFKVGAEWVHSDLFSRSQWLGLKDNARDTLAAGGTMTSTLHDSEGDAIVWKMMDGSFVPVTVQLAFDVVAAVTRSDMAIFKVAEQHNYAMRAAADPAAYDCTTGWPQTYAESVEILPVDPETIPPVDPEPETPSEPEPEPETDPEPAPETDPESLPDPEEEGAP